MSNTTMQGYLRLNFSDNNLATLIVTLDSTCPSSLEQ